MEKLSDKQISEIWEMVFNLAVQMLHSPMAAEDAVQEVFEKVLEKSSGFKGQSKYSTWVYRIAHNHFIDKIRSEKQKEEISFDLFEQDAQTFKPYENEWGLSAEEEKIYSYEVKAGCTMAMLQCLDPEDRFILVLGEIFSLDSSRGAEICDISPELFRKKLSRIRKKTRNFMSANCGLINPEAFCRCRKRLIIARDRGRLNPEQLIFQTENRKIRDYTREMESLDEMARIFKDNPWFQLDSTLVDSFKEHCRILNETSPGLFEVKAG